MPGSFGRIATAVAIAAVAAFAAPTAAHASTPDVPKVAAAKWYYLDTYPNRAFCDSAAEQVKQQNPGVYPQCRGPFSGGVFQLWYYI
ncbi:hypothetical protein OG887_42670 (plasmid) [Streptomyces sp. NBC_00053]|uniref:hypothetical protein n=1 Tax=Streptomyces TaxID=1883 RepID=UPI000F5BF2EB|nr:MULTISPECIES: hypothetical protein [unclassified Streptomyces]WSG56130.1 hypothetical protein OHA38_41060 [Streptomyces sp. NBC_01732]WSW11249.1 hypothetical protein OG298_44330 [Streptomyces sp. NBC_01005]WSX07296.1 hypothetical protein OG355_43925 [Streptomyces sp. NBC_00987]WTB51783.1 hypothetical protein OG832_00400 [Streptomyces sp. NBC_00826]WTD00758.1 hypothetical protein OH736_44335 [Streptomyces sp. NBC_01650]WTH95325.1 hypothetical protein OIC43_43280 [Streptomyces sp. NBC_00825]